MTSLHAARALMQFRRAVDQADLDAIMRLRDDIYVQDQDRLADAADFQSSFDVYDEYATYIIGAVDGRDVGVVKVIADSPIGLPCDTTVDLAPLRKQGRLAEIGHLMTLPDTRHRGVGVALMKVALDHAMDHGPVDIVLGDFFATPQGGLHEFYQSLGFFQVGETYRDDRFRNSPWSVVGGLDISRAIHRAREDDATEAMIFLFGDLDLPGTEHSAAEGGSV